MFSLHKTPAPAQGDEYDDEQHLVAAVSEFKKVDASAQNMVDLLYQRLASPFRITSKPCESNRTAVLQCYQQLQSSSGDSTASGPSPSSAADDAWLSVPYQRCYEVAMAYHQCVEKETLSKHLALAASFEQRGAQQKLVHQAATETQKHAPSP